MLLKDIFGNLKKSVLNKDKLIYEKVDGVVCGGVWWCVVVCGGVWWCVAVCGGVGWCMVVCGGVGWFGVVCGSVGWCVVVCGAVWCCVVVCMVVCTVVCKLFLLTKTTRNNKKTQQHRPQQKIK